MTNEELDAIYERVNKATPGPWAETSIMGETWINGPDIFNDAVMRTDAAELSLEDAEFIAHARTDIPALLDIVRKARAGYDRYAANARECGVNAMTFCEWLNMVAGN